MSNCRLGSVHKEFETIQRCAARSGQPVAAGERGRARADLGHESDASVCQDCKRANSRLNAGEHAKS